jgi:hypothetical protein
LASGKAQRVVGGPGPCPRRFGRILDIIPGVFDVVSPTSSHTGNAIADGTASVSDPVADGANGLASDSPGASNGIVDGTIYRIKKSVKDSHGMEML